LGNAILVCTTEMRSDEDIEAYAKAMKEVFASTVTNETLAESA